MASLASDIRRASLRCHAETECQHDAVLKDAVWFTMRDIPELTVCAACFDEVVRPAIDSGGNAKPLVNFYTRPQIRASASCMLYSARMREVFRRAVARDDLKLLERTVRERISIKEHISAELRRLDAQSDGVDPMVTRHEIYRLLADWKRWE